jgi:hypothetical protein
MMGAFENMIKKSNEKNDRINKYMNTKNVETLELFKDLVDFLVREKKANNKIINDIKKFEPINSEIVYFNVGGTSFSTLKSNLFKASNEKEPFYNRTNYFEALFLGLINVTYTRNNEIFVDRNPKYFDLILDFLRTINTNETFELPKNNEIIKWLSKEADYFMLDDLNDLIVPFQHSSILNLTQRTNLLKLTEFSIEKWKLIYRASLHGFRASDFHEKCDGVSKTLTIIRSSNSNIFGGYTEAQWDSFGQIKSDPAAFIFSLENKENNPLKLSIKNQNKAIYCNPKSGPTFGYEAKNTDFSDYSSQSRYTLTKKSIYKIEREVSFNNDLSISDQSNLKSDSFSSLNSSYSYDLNKHILAGSEYFQVDEIEVYRKIE